MTHAAPSELVHALAPAAQGAAGDSASPEAVRRLRRRVSRSATTVKSARKHLEALKSALMAIAARNFDKGAEQALQALKIDESSGLAWHVLAICREKQGDLIGALQCYEAALALLPNETDIAQDLGRLAQLLGYLDIAEKLLLKHLVANPMDIEGTNNLACVQRDQKRYGEAVETLRALIAIEPGSPVLWNTLGTVLSDQGEITTALTFFDEALRLDPIFAKALYNRANVRHPLGDTPGALADFEAALKGADTPYEAAMMKMARSFLLMSLGRIPEGFREYEVRFDPALPEAMAVAIDAPRWREADELEGKRVLIVGEQGLADEMVFGSVLASAIEAVGPAGKVYVAVEPRLVGLFQRSFPTVTVGAHKSIKLHGRVTRYIPFLDDLGGPAAIDLWCPMGSLMSRFRQSLDAFPRDAGFLRIDPDKVEHWRAELARLGDGVKVGLHWKSLVLDGSRARYFSSFDRWAPVLGVPGAIMINLQCGDVSADLAEAEAAGVRIWTPPIDLKDDLEDLAALSVAADVVIGPGIAGTNLAAAVGANVWMTTAPDDWHYLGTDGYPFYPQVRAYRRASFHDWGDVIAQFERDLIQLASDRRRSA